MTKRIIDLSSLFTTTRDNMILWICILSLSIGGIFAMDNGLALTPPMGWMHWERYRCIVDCTLYPKECISEKLFKRVADIMVSDGYLAAGYEYVMVDDCWTSFNRNPLTNRLEPNATRFPSGMKALADYIHDKGLKFGIYGDAGTLTCGGYPGSIDHMELDAQTFADWGVDYLKFDGCYMDTDIMNEGYANMSRYLNATGRPITYSCSLPAYLEPSGILPNYTHLTKYCNLWRNWDDIDDSWSSVTSIMDWFSKNQKRIAPVAGPGHWNDPDMLIIGNFGLSYEQSKSQLAVWAILAAPFIMSVDLENIEPKFRELLLDKDVIRINQDKMGQQGVLKFTINNIHVWTRSITPIVDNFCSYAIAFISRRSDGYPYRVVVRLRTLGLENSGGYLIEDIYEKVNRSILLPDDALEVRVKPSGAVLLKATPVSKDI